MDIIMDGGDQRFLWDPSSVGVLDLAPSDLSDKAALLELEQYLFSTPVSNEKNSFATELLGNEYAYADGAVLGSFGHIDGACSDLADFGLASDSLLYMAPENADALLNPKSVCFPSDGVDDLIEFAVSQKWIPNITGSSVPLHMDTFNGAYGNASWQDYPMQFDGELFAEAGDVSADPNVVAVEEIPVFGTVEPVSSPSTSVQTDVSRRKNPPASASRSSPRSAKRPRRSASPVESVCSSKLSGSQASGSRSSRRTSKKITERKRGQNVHASRRYRDRKKGEEIDMFEGHRGLLKELADLTAQKKDLEIQLRFAIKTLEAKLIKREAKRSLH